MILRITAATILTASLAACVYIVNDQRVMIPVAVPVCGAQSDLTFPDLPPVPKLPPKGKTNAEINEGILIANIQELRDYAREVKRIAEDHAKTCQSR